MNNETSEIITDTASLADEQRDLADTAENADSEPANEQENDAEKQALLEQVGSLQAELLKEQIKVRLLLLGILPEKLESGAAMAYGLCLAGKSPDDAAGEIIDAYPHFKMTSRELPQFSAENAGTTDGFSAIRRIFSTR